MSEVEELLMINADKVIIKEKGIEIINTDVGNFVARFDKIVFKGKGIKEAIFVKEVR